MAGAIYTKEQWLDSQLSIARFYGGIRLNGVEYKVIPQTFDLVRKEWIPVYNAVGREKMIEFLKSKLTLKEAKEKAKEIKQKKQKVELNLFDQ